MFIQSDEAALLDDVDIEKAIPAGAADPDDDSLYAPTTPRDSDSNLDLAMQIVEEARADNAANPEVSCDAEDDMMLAEFLREPGVAPPHASLAQPENQSEDSSSTSSTSSSSPDDNAGDAPVAVMESVPDAAPGPDHLMAVPEHALEAGAAAVEAEAVAPPPAAAVEAEAVAPPLAAGEGVLGRPAAAPRAPVLDIAPRIPVLIWEDVRCPRCGRIAGQFKFAPGPQRRGEKDPPTWFMRVPNEQGKWTTSGSNFSRRQTHIVGESDRYPKEWIDKNRRCCRA